jgi:hypothetical protein
MHHVDRAEERVSTALPVRLQNGETGMTRNISASGIFYETAFPPAPDDPLAFSIEFQSGAGGLTLRCQGKVLRVERLGNRVGVAARILESKLAPGQGRPAPSRLEISDGFADSF